MLAVGVSILLSKSAFGRYLYAVGTSLTVAEYSGVPTLRTIVLAYMLSGCTAALAGVLITGYTGQAYLGMGDPYLFTSIAAVAIGGAAITGGHRALRRHYRRCLCPDHPDRSSARAEPVQRCASGRLRLRDPRHRLAWERRIAGVDLDVPEAVSHRPKLTEQDLRRAPKQPFRRSSSLH